MKKTFLIIAFLIVAIGINAQTKAILQIEPTDIKYIIASEKISNLKRSIETQIANQFISGNLVYEYETESFLNGLDSLLLIYRNSVSIYDTIEIDTLQLMSEHDSIFLKLSEAESKFNIENSYEYNKLLDRIEELENLLNNSVILKEYAEWVQPLGAHDAYKKGDKVLFNGKLYESIIDANVWSPNITGWKEVTK